MIDDNEKEKEAVGIAEPIPSSPPPIYGSPLSNSPNTQYSPPPPGQSYPAPIPQAHYGAPGQFSPPPGQPGQFAAPSQGQPGQYGAPGTYGYPQPGQGYFPPPGQSGQFSPQGQPAPLAAQHTGPMNPQHTGQMSPQHTGAPLNPQHTGGPLNPQHTGQLSHQMTGQMGYPGPAGYPPQSPMMQQQSQHLTMNYTPTNGTPGVPTPQTAYPATQMQQPFMTGSQFHQELWARCARGEHDIVVKHGIVGIITAIFLFPIGLLCLFMDVEKKCSRCGAQIAV